MKVPVGVGRHIKDAAGQVATRSIANPMLWLCAIISLPCLIASGVVSEPNASRLFHVGIAPVILACLAYVYFAFKVPDRLQTEEYRLRNKALTIFGDSSFGDQQPEDLIDGTPVTPRAIQRRLEGSRYE